jgi:hypothetical protein
MSEPVQCRCLRCCEEWVEANPPPMSPEYVDWMGKRPFRFGCEICGNKRCPHHSDHRFACTDSNEPGQPGSVFTRAPNPEAP